jgi:hypothetical protein
MSDLLEKMRAKLLRLEEEFASLLGSAPWVGHGGTPHIVDNSKGRRMIKVAEAHEEKLRRKNAEIEAQKEAIERQEMRERTRHTPTKKSQKFLEKNPISPILLWLEANGKVKQWERNPQLFFVVGLKKVALLTVGDKVGVSKKFMAANKEEFELCKALIREGEAAVKNISDTPVI